MAVPTTYLTSTKHLGEILERIQKASVPSKFTYEFLKQLGFPSSTDRPIIPLLKAMKFLDDSGVPLDRYRRYKDTTSSREVMAEGVREAYADVFAVDQDAQSLTNEQLKGIFARVSGKGESVTEKMALTFKALANHADWTAEPSSGVSDEPKRDEVGQDETSEAAHAVPLRLHHDIHIHLPTSTEVEVYDAIFKSLRENFAA